MKWVRMKDGKTAVVLTTPAQARAAAALGFSLEYTHFLSDGYDLPAYNRDGSEGWISVGVSAISPLLFSGGRVRGVVAV